MKYILDTDICIYFLKGLHDVDKSVRNVGVDKCYISEITVAELKFGAANSSRKVENKRIYNQFINSIQVVPISACLDHYAEEKSRLRKEGNILDDFDLLIACSAIVHNMTLVTNNYKHFRRIKDIKLENWSAT